MALEGWLDACEYKPQHIYIYKVKFWVRYLP